MDKHNKVAELLMDDSFQAWVISHGQENAVIWEKWISEHPEHVKELEQSKKIIWGLKKEKYQLPEEKKSALRRSIIRLTQNNPDEIILKDSESIERRHWLFWPGIAAAVVLLVTFVWGYHQLREQSSEEVQYATAYGEIKTYILPDSSRVTLNGNSSIKFHYQNIDEKLREVWLEGEGFFDVSHLDHQLESGNKRPVKFIVHTDNLSIKVLGTRFNVKARHERTQVVLEKGSIQLEIDEHKDSLLMQPDELVEVKRGEMLISQKIVETLNYTGWKEGVINFEGADYEEISSMLKDNYGLELHFPKDEVAQQINLRGTFPSDNIEILLEAIANVTHTTMKKKENTIMYQ
ncbi:FecR domain-containing protein [Catalinimonas sp. 4WD22]|uniref:FecR family protein n=1 Tax=Catalinimonas locisalis TaxID=3133978 RepID=UPI003101583E